jgi:hypothetical protein
MDSWWALFGHAGEPLSFRFVVQPALALLLGFRDGKVDARAGLPPFFFSMFAPGRRDRLGTALRTVALPLAMAVAMDALVQRAVAGRVDVAEAIVVGFLLIAAPYVVARGLTNRAVRRRTRRST